MPGRRGFIAGLLSGSAVTVTLGNTTVALANYRTKEAVVADPVSALPALEADQWSLVPEPSLTGNTALVDIFAVPTEVSASAIEGVPDSTYYPEGFRVRVNGGDPVTLMLGNRLNKRRHIRIPDTGEASVEMAVVWRNETDRVTDIQGAWSEAKTVTPAVTATPSITIYSHRTTGTAPAGFVFTAEVNGFGVLDPTKELHWKWDYGDPGSVHRRMRDDYKKVHGYYDNDAGEWVMNANVSYDHVGAHTFENPGTHGVTLTITDRQGNSFTSDPYPITIADPDVVFAGTKTIVIAPSGMTDIGPTGARYFTNPADARGAWTSSTGRYRLLLERGYSYDLGGHLNRPLELQIGACGNGYDPVIDNHLYVKWGNGDELGYAIWGIHFKDNYDAADPPVGFVPSNAITCDVDDITVHDCKFDGWDVQFRPQDVGKRWVLSSCELTNWANFGVFTGVVARHAVIGCTMYQNPNALRNADGKSLNPVDNKWYADHGPYRHNNLRDDCAIIQSDLFSCVTWIGNQIQICIRINAMGDPGYAMNVSQCMLEGGGFFIGPTAGQDGSASVDIKVSKTLHIPIAGGFLGSQFGGVLLENNVTVRGTTPNEGGEGKSYISVEEAYQPPSGGSFGKPFSRERPNKGLAQEMPITFRNNTFVDLRDAGAVPGDFVISEVSDFQDVTISDNVFHGPNVPGVGAVANLDLSLKFATRYLGRRYLGQNGDAMQTEYATASAGVVPVPLTGCPAIGTATGEVALDDFHGNLRKPIVDGLTRTGYSQGAFEPALDS